MGRGRHNKKLQKKITRRTRGHFWNQEYQDDRHLQLSEAHSSDLEKFFRWLQRRDVYDLPTAQDSVVDIGCGNGRNIIYVCKTFGCTGIGYDLSQTAITQATQRAEEAQCTIDFFVRDAGTTIPAPDASQKIVLDMMVSHVLPRQKRQNLLREIDRVLTPGGFLFLKTFLRDGDAHAEDLLSRYPGHEPGSYIHPAIGIEEHVFRQEEIEDDVAQVFTLHKVFTSHRHRDKRGRAKKRRSIVLYAQKKELY